MGGSGIWALKPADVVYCVDLSDGRDSRANKFLHFFRDFMQLLIRHLRKHRQRNNFRGYALGDRKIALASTETRAHWRQMQRQIMKNGENP